jgi:serine/threonine protein kinase
VIARFEMERQALALMDHPGIAQVHEAGETETGHPYFVMEYVEGIPITAFCDRERLRIPERLELFAQVCDAVQHAHQKGVIHRDIKPSNVVVANRDGTPSPKVIDFGIVKATTSSDSDTMPGATVMTREGMIVGTLAYMSPEQTGAPGDVDTRSDIYSLGALLYELLTGSPPFDAKRMSQASLTDAVRMIREEDPPTLATRLTRSGEQAVAQIAARRSSPRARSQG